MLTIHCQDCSAATQFMNRQEATNENWENINIKGVNGPFGNEASGRCPDCVSTNFEER